MTQINLINYKKFVDDGVKLDNDSVRERLLLAAVGLAGETGEVVDIIKKVMFHRKPLDNEMREKLVLELGDALWYFFLILHTLDIDFGEVIEKNVHKLVNRYPEKHPELLDQYSDDPHHNNATPYNATKGLTNVED